jgi:endonuclease-8
LILLTHMLMSGSWHLYRPHENWQRPRSAMRVIIRTAEWEAVGFNLPVAEFHSARTLERHPKLMKIGPDILSSKFVLADGVKALLKHQEIEPEREIGQVLLDQQVIAGLGNVYKSEVCFATKVNPFRAMQTLTLAEIEAIVSIAHRYMASNVVDGAGGSIVTYTGLRRTTGSSSHEARLWVYRRRGQECRRCGTLIEMRKQGQGARSTFWCPLCQPMGSNSL